MAFLGAKQGETRGGGHGWEKGVAGWNPAEKTEHGEEET